MGFALFKPDGALDATFAGDGTLALSTYSKGDAAKAIAVQSSGLIVAAGYRSTGSGVDWVVTRITAAGVKDATFGSNGVTVLDFGAYLDYAFGMAVQADDKIVVIGYTEKGTKDVAVARFTKDGQLDLDFGVSGKRLIDFGGGNDFGFDVVVQPNGRLVVTGAASVSGVERFGVARLWP